MDVCAPPQTEARRRRESPPSPSYTPVVKAGCAITRCCEDELEAGARGVVRNSRVGGQQAQARSCAAETQRDKPVSPGVFCGNVNHGAEHGGQITVGRYQSAPAALAHGAAPHAVVMMEGAHTMAGRASANFCGHGRSAHASPLRPGGKQRGNRQEGQNSSSGAHVFGLGTPSGSLAEFQR